MVDFRGTNGPGYGAHVSKYGEIAALAVQFSEQRYASGKFEGAYQAIGHHTYAGAGTHNVLYIENTNADGKLYVVTYMRLSVVGITGSLPAAGDYFSIGKGMELGASSRPVVPENMHFGSAKTATGTFDDDNPTLTGTFVEVDRWYPDGEGKMMTFNKQGSVLIPQGKSLTVRYVAATTAGTLYSRVSFLEVEPYNELFT